MTLAEAKSIALKNAGVSSGEATFTTARKDRDDGVSYYEIEFCSAGVEYEYEISLSGKIIDKEIDRD
ncbi:MAG: PepSY domain-containing protein [Eubacteriaceae bacterium]|nr:PepSY domain-containing protein [Eubacteriaceae bacterium]